MRKPQWTWDPRLQTWKPDVNLFGLGVAVAALVWGYTPPDSPSPWDAGLVLLFSVAGGGFLIAGALAKVPTVVVERWWDEQNDALRNTTEDVVKYADDVYDAYFQRGEVTRSSWQDYAALVAIPKADRRPLASWEARLRDHESEAISFFYKFAADIEQHPAVSKWRRLAVRTYDRFGRLDAANADGFREWMDAEGVSEGAESLLVLLAYLEVARASKVRVGRIGRSRKGFWDLAEKWHPNTLALPRDV